MKVRPLVPVALAALAALALACMPPPPPPVDEDECFAPRAICEETVPEADDACLPPCGNPIGVGQPCTKDGGECASFSYFERGEAGFCTVDFRDVPLAYCSRPCERDEDCGCGAVCVPDPDGGGTRGCRIDGCEN